jgi:predicted  nucleic acid-binding Zn-ribbon protein
LALRVRTLRAKNNPEMTDDITTRPMLEALLEGQQQLGSQMAEVRAALGTISENQNELAAKQDEFAATQNEIAATQNDLAATQNEIAAKQDEFAAKQDQLDARITALTREVRNGFDDYNRKINALNQRLLSFETWLSRIDDRLHEEIIARTR